MRLNLSRLFDSARFSSLYRTTPQDDEAQDDFWNAAVVGEWAGTPASLLERLLMLEAAWGRQRDPSRPKGPRVLDLDLLIFGDVVLESSRLWLPHPRLAQRRFALEPLVELYPDARQPGKGPLWSDVLARLPSQGVDRTSLPW